jgi:hypothetical protein
MRNQLGNDLLSSIRRECKGSTAELHPRPSHDSSVSEVWRKVGFGRNATEQGDDDELLRTQGSSALSDETDAIDVAVASVFRLLSVVLRYEQ